MPTESTEMYLTSIFRLTGKTPRATVSDIAANLKISLPSVSEKVKHMMEQGYVIHEWREGVSLTEKGRFVALKMLRKRRLIETFLVKMAGYLIDEVHEDACRLEHAVSDRLADCLDDMLDNPKVDPHGHPIPSKEGKIEIFSHQSLADFSPEDTVILKRLDCLIPQERLSYLRELGLVPGTTIRIVEKAPFGGPLTIQIGDKTVAIAREIAPHIGVSPVKESDVKSLMKNERQK